LVQEASRLEAKLVESGDEDSAACLLCGECAMKTAWNRMVDAQQAWTGAMRAHPVGQQFRQLAAVPFQVDCVLFPDVAFMSVGMVVRESECTILRRDAERVRSRERARVRRPIRWRPRHRG
jgi:hypothetical protein